MEAVAQLERWRDRVSVPVPRRAVPVPTALEALLGDARSCAEDAADGVHHLGLDESALFAARVEELSRTVEYLQIVAAGQLDRLRTQTDGPATAPAGWTTGWRDTTGLSRTTGQQDGGTAQPTAGPPAA